MGLLEPHARHHPCLVEGTLSSNIIKMLSLDLRDKRVVFVDDGTNEYRTMCFTIAAKIVKKRGAEVENVKPEPGEASHAKVVDLGKSERPKPSRSPGALRRSLRE